MRHSNRPNLNSFKLRNEVCTTKAGNRENLLVGLELKGTEFSIVLHSNRLNFNLQQRKVGIALKTSSVEHEVFVVTNRTVGERLQKREVSEAAISL